MIDGILNKVNENERWTTSLAPSSGAISSIMDGTITALKFPDGYDILTIIITFAFCTLLCGIIIGLYVYSSSKLPFVYFRTSLNRRDYHNMPRKLNNWYRFLIFSGSENIYNNFGIDTLVFIVLVRLLLAVSVGIAAVSWTFILPINVISANTDITLSSILYKITISNIPSGSPILWVHFIFVYVFSFYVMMLCVYTWRVMVYWKQRYFRDYHLYNRTIIISGISRSVVESDAELENFLSRTVHVPLNKYCFYKMKSCYKVVSTIKACDKTLFKICNAAIEAGILTFKYERFDNFRTKTTFFKGVVRKDSAEAIDNPVIINEEHVENEQNESERRSLPAYARNKEQFMKNISLDDTYLDVDNKKKLLVSIKDTSSVNNSRMNIVGSRKHSQIKSKQKESTMADAKPIISEPDLTKITNNNSTINFDEHPNLKTLLTNYSNTINDTQNAIDKLDVLGSVLLVFKQAHALHTISLSKICIDNPSLHITVVPEPHGIYWKNLSHSKYTRATAYSIVWFCTVIMVLFWSFPFVLISTLSKTIVIADQYNLLKIENQTMRVLLQTLLESLLPVTLLLVFYLCLPYLFKFLSRLEGHLSKVDIETSMFTKFSIFHIVNTFFVFLISSSFLERLQEILREPLKIGERLADTLPMQTNFFCMYMLYFALVVHPFDLLNFVSFCKYAFSKQKRNLFFWRICCKPFQPFYPLMISRVIYIFGIGLSLCLMSPLIMLVVVFYMTAALFAFSYKILYSYKEKYSFKGAFWIKAYDWIVTYLVIFQLLTLGLITLKSGSLQSGLLLPLPIITLCGNYLIKSQYQKLYTQMTLLTLNEIPEASDEEVANIINSYEIEKNKPEPFVVSNFTLPNAYTHLPRYVPLEKIVETQ